MFKFKERPYNLLLLTAILLFIAGLFSGNFPIDILLHDTYFVLPITYLLWFPSFVLAFFWLLYLLTKRFLFSKVLMWTHITLTIICSVFIHVIPYLSVYSSAGLAGAPRRYYDNDISNKYRVFNNMNTIILLTLIVLLLGQLIYFVNLIIGFYKRKNLRTQYNST